MTICAVGTMVMVCALPAMVTINDCPYFSKGKRNRGNKLNLNEGTILCLLDEEKIIILCLPLSSVS